MRPKVELKQPRFVRLLRNQQQPPQSSHRKTQLKQTKGANRSGHALISRRVPS
jgi:hypothetical protein